VSAPGARLAVAVCLGLAACAPKDAPPAMLSHDDFKALGWLAGTWRGSGGNYPAFFEEYALVNDTTIRMRNVKDSTFTSATDSSLIVWSGGSVISGKSRVVQLRGDTVRFESRPGMQGYTYTWIRTSDSTWSATLGDGTVYQMRRVTPFIARPGRGRR